MVPRPQVGLAGCQQCRLFILRQFTSHHLPFISQRATTVPLRRPLIQSTGASRVSSTNTRPNAFIRDERPAEPLSSEKEESATAEAATAEADDDKSASQATDSDTPWYMQVEPPQHPSLSIPRQQLPDLPPSPPPLLEPLLTYVSDECGLDALSLLDLRKLDPPPGLGPNLIMLLGTARSERHLHVSAGRLVRWLRAEHGIWADADGLLGPNELKIKLRRAARKAKLLGSNSRRREHDDGIQTGWICVNLGSRRHAPSEEELADDEGQLTGFGRRVETGSTIVVQLLTEERREELDLERLWIKILEKNERDTRQGTPDPSSRSARDRLYAASDSPRPRRRSGLKNARSFSTLARRDANSYRHQGLSRTVGRSRHDSTALEDISVILTYDEGEKRQLLGQLKSYLIELTPSQARQTLASSSERQSSYMKVVDAASSYLPQADTWPFHTWLHSYGRKLGHPEFILQTTYELVDEMRLSGIQATEQQYMQLLGAIYSGAEKVEAQSEVAIALLQTMHERGQLALNNELFVTIIEALAPAVRGNDFVRRVQTTLEEFRLELELPYMGEGLLLRLMEAYAVQDDWDKFWNTWRIPPRFCQPRSPAVYEYVYRRMAKTRHQSRCVQTVRGCFHEMLNENPPVQPDDEVLSALKDCIGVADPWAARLVQEIDEGRLSELRESAVRKHEFVKLLRSLDGLEA